MKQHQILRAAGLALLICGLAKAGTRAPFDAPGAGTGAYQGTFALAINPAGKIVGYFTDASNLAHGFVRERDGSFVTFDAPGAVNGTFPAAINPGGWITGYYFDANLLAHGFVRTFNGSFVVFDAPGAVQGTFPSGISILGEITGNFLESSLVYHSFVRTVTGAIKVFSDPNAGTGEFEGTSAAEVDPQGAVVGCYTDSHSYGFNFLRTPAGTLSMLNPPGGGGGYFGCNGIFSVVAFSVSINELGVVAGTYFQPIEGAGFGGNYRGFARASDGNYTTFDTVPSPSSPCCTWTIPLSINREGQIVGYDNDFHDVNHGFVRAPSGAITLLDAPGAGTAPFQGTFATSTNAAGMIAGYYTDSSNVAHGFLSTPFPNQSAH